jgi:outer membrane protein OmpA-like peptidoglycan-associated protein
MALSAMAFGAAENASRPREIRVLQYMEMNPTHGLVVMNAGATSGVVAGDVFVVSRSASRGRLSDPATRQASGLYVETGKLKAVKVEAERTIAEVLVDGTEISRASLGSYAGVMAGDRVAFDRPIVERNPRMTPEVTLSFQRLFADPSRGANNYELTAEGMEVLRRAAGEFEDARLSMLLIKGYTDPSGSAEQNQVESYQRAVAIREFLVRELAFDRERVVALGLGETESIGEDMTPDYSENQRVIVMKAMNDQDLE